MHTWPKLASRLTTASSSLAAPDEDAEPTVVGRRFPHLEERLAARRARIEHRRRRASIGTLRTLLPTER